jgi:tRNA (mo5U34)-methyltransferase
MTDMRGTKRAKRKAANLRHGDLIEKIKSFEYWHYPFDLGNGVMIKTVCSKEKLDLRDFIWPVALDLCGGSLERMRVLDVGCNAGFWSLQAHRSGAEYVLGIDARTVHIEQAQLVRDALGISPEQIEFRQMNVYDLSPESVGKYDLCLFLRVLQHLRNPLLALEKLRAICQAYVVIDVKMVRIDWPVLYLNDEDPDGSLEGIDGLAAKPSQLAVELMLNRSGFADVKMIPARQPLEDAYFYGKRAVFTARVSQIESI